MTMLFSDHPNNPAHYCVDYVYADGRLEKLHGTDLLCAEQHTQFLPGIWPVQVTDETGEVRECVVFSWGTGAKRSGRCVLADDIEALKYNALCFVAEKWIIHDNPIDRFLKALEVRPPKIEKVFGINEDPTEGIEQAKAVVQDKKWLE